jgi:REP element-mobilizing transposase RayT
VSDTILASGLLSVAAMPRKTLIVSKDFPYHITARANNKEPFPGDLQFIWKTLANELYLQAITHGVRIHAFVLMPNHFHLLVTTPNKSIDMVMKEFIGSSTRIINAKYQRWGRIFGGRYHWTLVDNPHYYAHVLKYVYRNPAKAGLCERVENYPYSTFSRLSGFGRLPVPVLAPLGNLDGQLPSSEQSFAALESWLNQPHKKEEYLAIRKALKRKIFELGISRTRRKKEHLPELT